MKYLFFLFPFFLQAQVITHNKSIDIGQVESAISILPTGENEFILFGGYLDTLSYWQGFNLTKIDSLGNMLWNRPSKFLLYHQVSTYI